jgi:hypothetical protein
LWCGLCFGKPHELRFDLTTKQDVINDDNKTTTNNFLILNNIFNKYLNIEVFIYKKQIMAQPIKYNTGSKTAGCCISKGNYDIGVVSNYAYGPTASTGFWAGYPSGTTIPTGGFISYQNKVSQGPSIYNIPSVNDLVYFGTQLNLGVSASTPSEVIATCSKINTIALVNIDYPELPLINNNILTLDAGYTASYPWMDPNWFDVAGGTVTQASLSGGTIWVSGTSGVNYSDSYLNMLSSAGGQFADCPAFGSALQEFTISVWINTNGAPNNITKVCVVGQIYGAQGDCNFAIRGNGTDGYQGLIKIGGADSIVDFGSSIPNNAWVNLVFTFDGTNTMIAYVDSVQRGSAAGPAGTLISNGLKTVIGGTETGTSVSGGDTFNGFINNVVIYNTALDSGQVGELYNAYKNQRGF